MNKLYALCTLMTVTSVWSYTPENKPNNAWSRIALPTLGDARAVGSYSNGCMLGARSLPESGTGFVDMRRNRNRYYGQPELISFIEALGAFTDDEHGGKHLIGDLSQPRGGRMNFGHTSHRIGLDVDIWMQVVDRQDSVSPYRDMQTIVDKAKGTLLNPALPKATRDALHFSALRPEVARIFVNPVVKQHLCETERDTSWLRKLRPWWGHDQHFHVRLRCDDAQAACVNQAPPPPGDGCNASLRSWVDEQSGLVTGRIKPKKRNVKKRKPKVLPVACQQLIQ